MTNEPKNEVNVQMNVKAKPKTVAIAGIIVIALIGVIFLVLTGSMKKMKAENEELKKLVDEALRYEEVSKEVLLSRISSEINDIGELATIEYLYTNAGKFQDAKKFLGINAPFSKKSFIAKWDGIIKAGVKISDVEVDVNNIQKVITIYMPEAEILSHEIDNNSIETLDEKDGLFNPVTVEDVREFDKISKEEMEKRAIENGVLEKAYENAKTIIERLVNNEVVQKEGYTIKFETK